MNRIRLLTLAVLLVAGTYAATAQVATNVDGTVTKVDQTAEKITIRHSALKAFDMDDGHTMVFRTADPAMLKLVKAGDKVKFDVERINGQFTVTKLQKAR
jgi:Cu(I)/Ag(I) efflux system periplasmic protein CusF